MKIQVLNYTFNKTAKTITFDDYTSIRLDGILLVTNVEDNIIIYNFASPTLGGSVSTNVLTLDYDTSTMSDSDSLQIFYEDPEQDQYSLIETLQELSARLQVLASMSNAGAPALRTIPIASVSTAVTGTVTATVANATIATIGGVPGYVVSNAQNNVLVELANINNVTA